MVTIRPDITYNKEKCGDPTTCLKCVNICPYCIIAYRPLVYPEPPNPPEEWTIVATTRVLCPYPACKLCIEACPKDALDITIPTM